MGAHARNDGQGSARARLNPVAEEIRPLMVGFSIRRRVSRCDAEDMVQTSLTQAYEALVDRSQLIDGKTEGDFKRLAFRVLRCRIADHWKESRSRKSVSLSEEHEGRAGAESDRSQEGMITWDELAPVVRERVLADHLCAALFLRLARIMEDNTPMPSKQEFGRELNDVDVAVNNGSRIRDVGSLAELFLRTLLRLNRLTDRGIIDECHRRGRTHGESI